MEIEIKKEVLTEVRCNRCSTHIGHAKIVAFLDKGIPYVKTMQNTDFYCEMLCDRCKSEMKGEK